MGRIKVDRSEDAVPYTIIAALHSGYKQFYSCMYAFRETSRSFVKYHLYISETWSEHKWHTLEEDLLYDIIGVGIRPAGCALSTKAASNNHNTDARVNSCVNVVAANIPLMIYCIARKRV